jgi:tripartite-type tricarboxylate transporter receptor subunit TctC
LLSLRRLEFIILRCRAGGDEFMRRFFASSILVATLAGGAVGLAPATAEQYPAQDIHFVCVTPPGTGADVFVRYFAEKVKPLAGRTIIVENRAGAGGIIAMEYAARAKADGYTVLVHAGGSVAGSKWLYKKPPFADAGQALQVVATIDQQGYMLIVDGKSPYPDVAALTAAMRSKGDKASYLTTSHTGRVMGELYKASAGLKTVEVTYKVTADGLNDLASGALDFGAVEPVFALSQQRAGRIRIIGVSTADRLKSAPDLPTMAEQGIPMDFKIWWAAMVPAGTPRPIVEQLNTWFAQVVASDETRTFLANFGADPLVETPEQGQARLVKDIEIWKNYTIAAGIEPQG